MFVKCMSHTDDANWEYYRLLLNFQENKIEEMKKMHPMDAKKMLAESLTSLFYGEDIGKKEREQFSHVFSKGKVPEDMPTFSLTSLSLDKKSLLNVLAATGQFESKGEIRRLVKQGAVKIDSESVDNPDIELKIEKDSENQIIKAGKKIFIKIVA